MEMIAKAGIGVAVMSWWGKDGYEDKSLNSYLDIASKYDVKLAFHIEPFYKTAEELKEQLEYISSEYGDHSAVFRVNNKPFYYLYDSYKLDVSEWQKLLTPEGSLSLRDTAADGTFIGLWVHENEGSFFANGGFDGFYTYFASNGFVYGSTTSNWQTLSSFATQNDLLFIPCVGPGYLDTRIRPWNGGNTKNRESGVYYEQMFSAALNTDPDFIGITSFNEWHEGTQIEPAIPFSVGNYTYEDYGEDTDPWFYIWKTKELLQDFK